MRIRMGTRKSRLAMVQTEMVRDAILACFPEAELELVLISTRGDKQLDKSLASFGGKGVFTKELEDALLAGEIDLAVHSAKDMPMEFPEGLALGAALRRANPADVLVTVSGIPADKLPPGSVIGTSSLRRELQMKRINPQVKIKLLRGNVGTRIDKLKDGGYDGILLAAAGLERLGLTEDEGIHFEYLDMERFLPAPGQGILGVEIRKGELAEVMAAIHDREAALALQAEREFLTVLGGSCNAPCAAYCRQEGSRLVMSAMFARDGIHPVYREGSAEITEDEDCVRRLADRLAAMVQVQRVSLVGAGPGDAALLTRKGLRCVREADVIVYDNLISGSILNEARLDAELIYAGKRADRHHLTQEQINELLIKEAMLGKYVVRLKGGDPFIFGRGGEEALALKERQIPFEIVPGVSSSYSVPAYAGIPVTHRGLASSFHVITGHEGAGKTEEALDYHTLAKEEGTLVFLMGLKRLDWIAKQLISCGKKGTTPAAVISKGTTAGQRRVVSDLAHIAEAAEEGGIVTPAITVVGDTAGLCGQLDWFGGKPLSGRRVLVTGTRYMAEELEKELGLLGAETVAVSVIESRLLQTEQLAGTLEELEQYQWIVFTSGNGAELFFRLLRLRGIDLRRLMHLKFAAIGRKTAAVLREHGFICDFVPSGFSSEDLAREWIPTLGKEERVLLMRAKEGSSVLPKKLYEAGICFQDTALYETWVDTRRREELNRLVQEVDYVTVASGSAARALGEMLEDKERMKARLIAIGPFTAREAKKAGLSVYAAAAEYTAEGIADVILSDVILSDGILSDGILSDGILSDEISTDEISEDAISADAERGRG